MFLLFGCIDRDSNVKLVTKGKSSSHDVEVATRWRVKRASVDGGPLLRSRGEESPLGDIFDCSAKH